MYKNAPHFVQILYLARVNVQEELLSVIVIPLVPAVFFVVIFILASEHVHTVAWLIDALCSTMENNSLLVEIGLFRSKVDNSSKSPPSCLVTILDKYQLHE